MILACSSSDSILKRISGKVLVAAEVGSSFGVGNDCGRGFWEYAATLDDGRGSWIGAGTRDDRSIAANRSALARRSLPSAMDAKS